MSREDNKGKERLLSILILIIAGFGFLGGILYNHHDARASKQFSKAAEYENTADSMTLFVQSLYERDLNYFSQANVAFKEAANLIIEWNEILKLGLLPADELFENTTLKSQITGKFREGESLQQNSIVMHFWWNFEVNNVTSVLLADSYTHGFVYMITDVIWNLYHDTYTILETIPRITFINETLLGGPFPDGVPDYILNEMPNITYFEFNEIAYQLLLYDPLLDAHYLAENTLHSANSIQDFVDSIAITVSFTTIAVVLSGAMSERLNKKKLERYISRIRAEIQEDESLLITRRDRIAKLGLILALIIALTGFVLLIPF